MQKVVHIIKEEYPELLGNGHIEKSFFLDVPCNGKLINTIYHPGTHDLHLFYMVEENYQMCEKEFLITTSREYRKINEYKYLDSYLVRSTIFPNGTWNHLFVMESD